MMGSCLNAAREMIVKAGQSAMVATCTENVIFTRVEFHHLLVGEMIDGFMGWCVGARCSM